MRSVLRYPGSKWNIARSLVDLIPEHHSYVEPYFGSGAVFFSKPYSDIEILILLIFLGVYRQIVILWPDLL